MDLKPSCVSSPALVAALQADNLGALMLIPEAMRQTGLSRQGVYQAIKRGEFDCIPLSARKSALLESQVKDWIRRKVEAAVRGAQDPRRQAILEQRRAAAQASVAARKQSAAKAKAADAKRVADVPQGA